jgi:hypothetical protein
MKMSGAAPPIREVVSMLDNPTVEKLKDMKLKAMAQMLKDPDPALIELSFEERFGMMVKRNGWQEKTQG